MADIGVFHPDLSSIGGSQAVCMNILEAIESKHRVTLYTTKKPKISYLNSQFGTNVTDLSINQWWIITQTITKILKLMNTNSKHSLSRLQHSIANRLMDNSTHDIVISSYNEFSYNLPAIQYIHYPIGDRAQNGTLYSLYDIVCDFVHTYNNKTVEDSVMLTNSKWTADIIKDIYDTDVDVIYPPINTTGFEPQAWSDRETGFISIGRVNKNKKIHRNFEIISRLRNIGFDVHIHHVGPIPDTEYGKKIRQMSNNSGYLHLEGAVPREKIIDLVCSHQYGIHGKNKEHFGMAVAELATGGALPFVPKSGGQCEIVQNQSDLMYENTQEAVYKIKRILSCENKQDTLRRKISNKSYKYNKEVFQSSICSEVNELLKNNKQI